MANYTPNLNLRKPLTGEYYDVVGDYNDMADKVDDEAGKLLDVAVNVKNYKHVVENGWSAAIQAAIDYVYGLGGGVVLIPHGTYEYNSDIHIKEGVRLIGGRKTILKCTHVTNGRMIIYNDVTVSGIEFELHSDYNNHLFYFDNRYLGRIGRKDRNMNQAKVIIENVRIYKRSRKTKTETPNMIAFYYYAAPQPEYSTLSGYWNITIRDCNVDNIPVIATMKTDGTGWINGCIMERVVGDNFEHAVIVDKSAESLGIDLNLFQHLKLQARGFTRDVFVEVNPGSAVTNFYRDNEIWDMKTFTDARMGNIYNARPANNYTINKERYTWILSVNRFYLLGRFTAFTSSVHHVTLNCVGPNGIKSDIIITGAGGGTIQRVHYGSSRSVNTLEFYKKTLSNGEVEIYVKTPSDIEFNLYFEGIRSFIPSPLVYYDTLSGITLMTTYEEQGPGANIAPQFSCATPFSNFPLGVTYTIVPLTSPTISQAPEGKNGVLTTYKMTTGETPGYSWQEYQVFNSVELYRRKATGSTTWGPWYKVDSIIT